MTPRVLILDPLLGSDGRDWAAIFHPHAVWLAAKWSELPSRQAGDVLIVHGRETLAFTPKLQNEASLLGLRVIVVSGNGFENPPADSPFYFRRAPVAPRREGVDREFGECVRRFLENPVWELLEPRAIAGVLSYSEDFLRLWEFDSLEGTALWVDCAGSIRRPGPFDWVVALALGAAPRWVFLIEPPIASESEWLLSLLPWVLMVSRNEVRISEELNQPPESRVSPEALRRLWADQLMSPASPADRHAISNLAGPRVLLGAGAATPLDKLLRLLHLVPEAGAIEPLPWCTRAEWTPYVNRFLLLDDLAEAGWSEFLTAALQLKPNELKVEIEAEKAIGIGPTVYLPDCQERDVLFLDLRLFTPRGVEAEFDFLTRLLPFARHLPDFAAMEMAVMTSQMESPGYYLALTLLPRLLAAAHPWLPIILFSSTGRREIVEALRPHANIIVNFDKPRFFGQAIADTARRFRDAMGAALFLARGRAHCLDLITRSRERALPVRRMERSQSPVVQIFIDECNHPHKLAVGGFVLIFPDSAAVTRFDHAWKSRPAWGLGEGHAPLAFTDPPPAEYLQVDAESQITQVQELVERWGLKGSGFVLLEDSVRIQKAGAASELLRDDGIDNLYRRMLADVLEGVLFELLPALCATPKSISIDVATRVVSAANPGLAERLRKDFGIGLTADGTRFFAFSSADVYPLTAEVLARRSRGITLPIRSARGVTLQDYGKLLDWFHNDQAEYKRRVEQLDHPRPRQIHYLARALTSLAVNLKSLDESPTARQWLERGFFQRRNKAFQDSLQASRAADREQWVDALTAILPVRPLSSLPNRTGAPAYEDLVIANAAAWPAKLDGSAFLDLCRRIQ